MKTYAKKVLLLLMLAVMVGSYQNCSLPSGGFQSGSAGSSALSSTSPTGGGDDQPAITPGADTGNAAALLSSDQAYRSMLAVTGVKNITFAVSSEYGRRDTFTLGDSYALTDVNSPMLLAFTNLAATVCNEAAQEELTETDAQRTLFAGVNFNAGASGLTETDYLGVVNGISSSIWGRSLTAEEQDLFKTARNDVLGAMTAGDLANKASTRTLMLVTCSAMLSSFDSISL